MLIFFFPCLCFGDDEAAAAAALLGDDPGVTWQTSTRFLRVWRHSRKLEKNGWCEMMQSEVRE